MRGQWGRSDLRPPRHSERTAYTVILHSTHSSLYRRLIVMASRRILERSRSCSSHAPYRISTRLFCSTASCCDNTAATASAALQPSTTTTTITGPAKPHTIDPRWLTTIKRRIGKCLMFGCTPAQVDVAGSILQQIARDWRELVAGSEGFLTGETRRSVFRHSVVWGEMVRL